MTKRIFAKTIGSDLIQVVPMTQPLRTLYYMEGSTNHLKYYLKGKNGAYLSDFITITFKYLCFDNSLIETIEREENFLFWGSEITEKTVNEIKLKYKLKQFINDSTKRRY